MNSPAESKTSPARGELAYKARSGMLWVAGLQLFRDVLQFGVMLVLVRLLEPVTYGQFSLISSVMLFFSVFSFRSFLEQTLQLRPAEWVDYQSHFTAAGFIQLAICGLMNVTAVLLGHTEKYAEVAPVLHFTSVFFLLDWPAEFRIKMLERDLSWNRLRVLQAIGLVANAALAVALAKAGAGVYALVLPGMMVTLPSIVDLFFVTGWRPDWSWRRSTYIPAVKYGFARIASGTMAAGRPLIESVVVVHTVGYSELGILGRAVGLATMTCLKIPSLLTTTLYPVLTRIPRDDEKYGRANSLVLRIVGWTVIPAAVLFSVIAAPVVHLLYGAKWDAAIALLPFALAGAVAAALYQTTTLLLLANLQQRTCALAEAFTFTGIIAALYLILPRGLTYYLAAVAIVQGLASASMLLSLCQSGVLSISTTGRDLAMALCCSAVAFVSAQILKGFELQYLPLVAVAVTSGLFLFVYAASLCLATPHQCLEILHHLPGGKHVSRISFLSHA